MWPRGTLLGWKDRLKTARLRLRSSIPLQVVLAASLVAFFGLGGWTFHNTNVLNEYVPGDLAKQRHADYENAYGKYRDLHHPRINAIHPHVHHFPDQHQM